MNKNTLIAVILSTIVLIGSFIVQAMLFPKIYEEQKVEVVSEIQSAEKLETEKNDEIINISITDELNLKEELISINTGKAEIMLTNLGGDIISYKLLEHIDVKTSEGVQMADNITKNNRACAVAFGNINSPIINSIFNIEKIDKYTILFTKKLIIENKNIIFGKRYTFLPNEYMFKLEILIHTEDESISAENNFFYTLRTSPQIGPHYDPKLNRYENRQFISYNGNKVKIIIVGQKKFDLYNKEYIWNGIAGKYFAELVIPENNMIMDNTYYSSLIEANNYANAQAVLVRKPIFEKDIKDTYYMYFGPKSEKHLKIYNLAENNFWKLSNLKLTESMQTTGWLSWLENILKLFMETLYKLIPNWGVSIIIMTIVLKLLMFPFTKKQSLSTLKMQKIQPKMQKIQEKYKDNPQKQQQAMAELYKESGYNPMSGCMPMLVQFLILFAMYNLFNNYFEFRGASFIPNWIPDLSAGDSIYTFKKNVPFFGNQLRILPIIYLISQLLFGKITQNGGTAAGSTQTQMNMMMYGMPIIFFFLFYNAPSGLLLYWTVSNIFQMGQQLFINKIMNAKKNEILNKN